MFFFMLCISLTWMELMVNWIWIIIRVCVCHKEARISIYSECVYVCVECSARYECCVCLLLLRRVLLIDK